jgi:hypothetical protein
MLEIVKAPKSIQNGFSFVAWVRAKLTKVRFRWQGPRVLSLSVAVLISTSLIALWLRSASLPLVNFVSQLTFSRFVRFCCQLSLKFRYSPSRKIWSA